MIRLQNLVALSAATKTAYDQATCPAERKRLGQMGADVAVMIGKARHLAAGAGGVMEALIKTIASLFRRRPEPVRMVRVRVSAIPTAWRRRK